MLSSIITVENVNTFETETVIASCPRSKKKLLIKSWIEDGRIQSRFAVEHEGRTVEVTQILLTAVAKYNGIYVPENDYQGAGNLIQVQHGEQC